MLPNLDFQIHSDENDINIKFLKYQKEERKRKYILIDFNKRKKVLFLCY